MPRMLPCQHTLCETCLHSYIVNKSRERVLVSDFPCPVCRTSTPAPRAFTRIDTWASLFPLNHLLVSLLDSSFHEIFEKKDPSTTMTTERCADHSGKHVEFFCIQHDVKLCSKCLKNSHRPCDILDIEEHIEFTSRFKAIKTNAENICTYLSDAIHFLKSNIDQLCQQRENILVEIKEFRGKIQALLNTMESDIKGQLDGQHNGEITMLKAQCEEYEKIKAEIDLSTKTLTDLPLAGNISESLEMVTAVENEMKDRLAFIQRCHSNIKRVKLELTVDGQCLKFLNSFRQIGAINTNRQDPDLRDPSEIVSQEPTPNDRIIPTRDSNVATESLSDDSTRALSPGAVVNSQSTARSNVQCDIDHTTADAQEARPEHRTKEQKRPKTVPIQSAPPTPVVRPRPERPNAREVPTFLPGLTSTPVNHIDLSVASHSPAAEVACSVPDNCTLSSSAFSHVKLSQMASLANNARHDNKGHNDRTFQYITMPKVGEMSSTKNQENEGNEDDSLSAERDHGPFTPSSDHTNNEAFISSNSCSEAAQSFQPIATSHQEEKQNFKPAIQQDIGPIYENTQSIFLQRPISSSTPGSNAHRTMNQKERFQQCTYLKTFGVRTEGDAQECTVTGSVVLMDKRLVLVDCNNSKLKLFSPDLAYLCHLDLKKEPWNLTTVTTNEIAVTVPLEKTIHVIRVARAMSTLRCIRTCHECWGIAYLNGKFIITTKDDGNEVVFLDGNGRKLHTVSFATHENPNILRPVSVTLVNDEDMLYVCCEGQSGTKGSIVRMSNNGDINYVFTNKDLDRPYCVASQTSSEIFVASIRSSNVLVMSSECGAHAMTLLSRDNGLNRPQHLNVLELEDKCLLIVTERRSDSAKVYWLKK